MDGNLILLIIAIVFLPGILWANIDSKYSSEPKPSFAFFIANSFVFGIVAYIILSLIFLLLGLFIILICTLFGINYLNVVLVWEKLIDSNNSLFSIMIQYFFTAEGLIIFSIVVALILTPFIAKIWLRIKRTDGVLNFFMKARNESSTGGIDIWTYFLEQDLKNYKLRVVDHKYGRCYEGEVELYSESERTREILLRNVSISNLNENSSSSCDNSHDDNKRDYLYFSLPDEYICIEFLKCEIGAEKQIENQ